MIDIVGKVEAEPACLMCRTHARKNMRTAMMECPVGASPEVFYLCDLCIETIHRRYVLYLKEKVDEKQSK